jgi:hypothetical protein
MKARWRAAFTPLAWERRRVAGGVGPRDCSMIKFSYKTNTPARRRRSQAIIC